jgi:hypothetical protein
MTPGYARRSQRVSAISCFGQGVWTKAKPHVGFGNFIDDFHLGPFVEVVYQLGSLITEKSSVFEAAVSLHGSNLVARLGATAPLAHRPASRLDWHL